MRHTPSHPGELDARVVVRVRAGERGAFDELVTRYHALVHALCTSVLEDIAAAEDVTQEAFLQAYQQLKGLQHADRFAPWLKTIAVRQCWAWAKAERRRRSKPPADPAALIDPFLDGLEQEERNLAWIDRIEAAVEAISEEHCCILSLFYVRGLSHDQIAHFLDIPLGTVKRRLHDARQSLQQALSTEEPMPGDQKAVHRFLAAFHKAVDARTAPSEG